MLEFDTGRDKPGTRVWVQRLLIQGTHVWPVVFGLGGTRAMVQAGTHLAVDIFGRLPDASAPSRDAYNAA